MLLQEFEIKDKLRELLVSENKSFTIDELQDKLTCSRFEAAVAVWELIDSKEASLTSERNSIIANLDNIQKLKELNGVA